MLGIVANEREARYQSFYTFMFQWTRISLTSSKKEMRTRFESFLDEISDTNGDVQYLNFVLNKMIDSSSHDEETSALIRRFTDSFMERFDVSSREVLWYASFGDLNANECIGCIEPPTRSQPVHEVVSPHRKFKIGEDPVCFERSQIEYMDTSNDVAEKNSSRSNTACVAIVSHIDLASYCKSEFEIRHAEVASSQIK